MSRMMIAAVTAALLVAPLRARGAGPDSRVLNFDSLACNRVAVEATQGSVSTLEVESRSADMDGDRLPDLVTIDDEGTMHIGRAEIVLAKTTKEPVEISGYDLGEWDLSLLRINGRHYILTGGREGPGRLWRVDAMGQPRQVCEFERTTAETMTVSRGTELGVCALASRDALPPVEFPHMHALDATKRGPRDWQRLPMRGLAQVDLNGDGATENVVRINYTSLVGRGCSSRYVAVTDDSRSEIPESPLNHLLLEKSECVGGSAGPDQEIVRHADAVYLQVTAGDEREVFRISDAEAAPLCAMRRTIGFQAKMIR
jgi:hypothetical protein